MDELRESSSNPHGLYLRCPVHCLPLCTACFKLYMRVASAGNRPYIVMTEHINLIDCTSQSIEQKGIRLW